MDKQKSNISAANTDQKPVLIFGGNGFVGTEVARILAEKAIPVICVSRTGTMPLHLSQQSWAQKVRWQQGDAKQPDAEVFHNARAVVTLIGSPPLPTFSQRAYDQQVFINGALNTRVIESASHAGISKIVVLGAHLPTLLQTTKFGYFVGKQASLDAARSFALQSAGHTAIVLQPTAIYGKRHRADGTEIAIDNIMRPIARLQQSLPAKIAKWLPEPLVAVEQVATMVVHAILDQTYADKFTVISNQHILKGPETDI